MARSVSNGAAGCAGRVAVLLCLVAGLSACRASATVGTSGAAAATVTNSRTSAAPTTTAEQLAPATAPMTGVAETMVVLGPGNPSFARAPRQVSWLAVRDDRDPRKVIITFMTGDCDGPAHATAADTGKTVTVSLIVDQQTAGGCDAAGWLRYADVVLPQPLSGRPVVDATSGQEHRVFDGAALLLPTALPQGLSLAREVSADPLRPKTAAVEAAPSYWEQVWQPPSKTGSHRPDCSPTGGATRGVALTQGPGTQPRWEPASLKRVGAVRLAGQDVAINRVIASDDLVLDWRDPVSHLNYQLSSDDECTGAPAYTVSAFSRIAKSLRNR
ncbi:hypothetical protein acdb102_27160 [Acidothermaceae bacterium B102]|nr:hypothetical protein acdb102_27160 [Acidothermaceae bacterium B102]